MLIGAGSGRQVDGLRAPTIMPLPEEVEGEPVEAGPARLSELLLLRRTPSHGTSTHRTPSDGAPTHQAAGRGSTTGRADNGSARGARDTSTGRTAGRAASDWSGCAAGDPRADTLAAR